jgi:hypothetical protein
MNDVRSEARDGGEIARSLEREKGRREQGKRSCLKETMSYHESYLGA